MHRSTARWTTAVAAAAMMALPAVGSAQTTPTTSTPTPTQQANPQSPQQPPAQPTPQPTTTPAPQPQQSPATPTPANPTPSTSPSQSPALDASAAKQHLTEARETLSQLTSLPEAARLQGDARTQVSELISNFNTLITTQANWRDSYAKVDGNLTTLLGPDASADQQAASGVAGAVGTTGAAPAAGIASLDPAIQAKLVEFRTHLKAFERAAGTSTSGDMAPSAATGASTSPANPSTPANPVDPTAAATAAGAGAGTSAAASPTSAMPAADQAKASEQVGHADATKEIDAISAILSKSKTGSLTKAQTALVKKHLEQLRVLLQQGQ